MACCPAMAASKHDHAVLPPGNQQPAWEVPRDYHTQPSVPPNGETYLDKHHPSGARITAIELLERLDKAIPPHRKYFGLRRRYFLSAVGALVILIVLAIGLGVGLIRHSGYVPYITIRIHPLTCSPAVTPFPSHQMPKPSLATLHITRPP